MIFLKHRASPPLPFVSRVIARAVVPAGARQFSVCRGNHRDRTAWTFGHEDAAVPLLVPIRFECFPNRRELATARCAFVTLSTRLPGLCRECRCCTCRSRN